MGDGNKSKQVDICEISYTFSKSLFGCLISILVNNMLLERELNSLSNAYSPADGS